MAKGLPDFQTPVNIVAQTLANLSVDIAAQTLEALGINITAQDLAELIIKINAQAVGIYIQPEWAGKEGIDKNFYGWDDDLAYEAVIYVAYTVPAGKQLYITALGLACYASVAANADANQMCRGFIYNQSTTTVLFAVGGNGGATIVLPKPIVIESGKTVWFVIANCANHTCDVFISASGYEV